MRSAHVCGIEELCIPKLSTSKGEIVENKQSLSSPAGERENIMGTMDINPLLIKLSVPMMVSMLVQALYNVVDSIFVSHVSESALTAVSLAFSLQNVMIAVGVGTGVGVNALLSKSLGEKNQERANKTAENGIFLSLCSYAVFLVIGLTCMKPYFYAQTSDMDIARQGIQYLQLCCVLSLGLFTQTMGEKLLAATGRTHLSMISQLVGAVVNIVLDPIFIFGYCGEALSGTTGAAAATVIGQFCGAGMTLYFNLNKNPDIQISFRGFRPSAKAIGRIYTVGLPPYVQSERQAQGIYLKYAKELVEKGEAYYCFCGKERLESLKQEVAGKEIIVYDKHCLHLSKEEVEAKLAAGVPYVIRQNIPNEGTTSFEDEIYGKIEVPNSELDDMILIKSDGYPTYNFAYISHTSIAPILCFLANVLL